MGRQSEPITINHFSHQHPLHLTNPQPSTTCSACKQTLATEPLYTCRSPSCTTFSLHLKCSKLPQRITHPCHHHHTLSLIPKPHNFNGVFACNACGNNCDGFSYTCKDCGVSIHTVCATVPLSLSHPSHGHQLNLVFLSPYPSGGFSCDVCGVIEGGKCWLYRCGLCGFDVHLSCATSKTQAVSGAGSSASQEMLFLNQINNQRNQNIEAMMMGYGGNMNNRLPQTMMGGGGGSMNNQILQAILGGGGGGSNQLLQAFMGGGGGGGSNQLLQAFMGGGGGGGGGGGDMIQSLLNGSNGGLGGLDLSSVLGNGGDIGGLMGAGLGGFGF